MLSVDGWPSAYARAAAADGPATLLMFRSSGDELEALRHIGYPFFTTPWRADELGLVLTPATDWSEVSELATESDCLLAPQRSNKGCPGRKITVPDVPWCREPTGIGCAEDGPPRDRPTRRR